MAGSRVSFFSLGLGAGACFGLLIAPKEGREIREQLLAGVSEGRDFVKRRSRELAHQAEEILDRGKSRAALRREHLTSALEAGREAYRRAVEQDIPPSSKAASE